MDVESNVTLCGTNSNEPQLFSIEKKNLFDDAWWQEHWGDNIADISQAYRKRAFPLNEKNRKLPIHNNPSESALS